MHLTSGLIREVAFGGGVPHKRGGLWWEVLHKRGGLWWEVPHKIETTVIILVYSCHNTDNIFYITKN